MCPNAAFPIWTEMEGNAVIVAEQEIDGNFQWAWGADDAVWIVRGTRVAEDYVRALLRVHATTLEPFDMQGMTGDLWDYTPSVPGYQYHDLSRADTLANLSGMGLGDCAERYYVGGRLPRRGHPAVLRQQRPLAHLAKDRQSVCRGGGPR